MWKVGKQRNSGCSVDPQRFHLCAAGARWGHLVLPEVLSKHMRFDKLEINPALNPGVLDTATWDRATAWTAIQAVADNVWPTLVEAARQTAPLPASGPLAPYTSSCAWYGGTLVCLASLIDGQQVFLAIGPQAADLPLGTPLGNKQLLSSAAGVSSQCSRCTRPMRRSSIASSVSWHRRGLRALGSVPRLGIGTRMTTAVWPAIWSAMRTARLRGQRNSKFGARAQLPANAARGPARREKHRVWLWCNRDGLQAVPSRGCGSRAY